MTDNPFTAEVARRLHDRETQGSPSWDELTAEQQSAQVTAVESVLTDMGMSVTYALSMRGNSRPLRPHEVDTVLSGRLKQAGAVIECRVTFPPTEVGGGPSHAGKAVPPVDELRCICSGQGGSVYSADCPLHDSHVDTADPYWRRRYDAHVEAQLKIKERLGW